MNGDSVFIPRRKAAEVNCYDCLQTLHNAGAVSRNTSQPAHNTERPA